VTMARAMVTEYGMSEKLGPLRYEDNEEEIFLGHSVAQRKNVSEATAKLIDEEVRRIVDEAEATARKILTEHSDDLHAIAGALLEYETLSGTDVDALLRGESIVRPDDDATPSPAKSTVPNAGNIGITPDPKPQPGS
ncbi:MAG: cell division protein FtsH, partial [Proteobacteria bacterium]|nr:cell division protein FtsH [Pseudomonadota bacterium]